MSSKHSKTGSYKLCSLLSGHKGPVACLSLHPDGRFIASGGYHGTMIWLLSNCKPVLRPTGAGTRGATTAISWISSSNTAIVFGTSEGWLCIWKLEADGRSFREIKCIRLEGRLGRDEIISIAFDPTSKLMAVAHRAEKLHLFQLDENLVPECKFSRNVKGHWPQVVTFGVSGRTIWSFGQEDGEIYVLDLTGGIKSITTRGMVIGGAAVDVDNDLICLDDPSQGVVITKMSGDEVIRTFPVPATQRKTRNVAFLDKGCAVASGSDHGIVYIFNCQSGKELDVLCGGEGWLQSICTAEIEGSTVIAAGQSGEHIEAADITLWTKKKQSRIMVYFRITSDMAHLGLMVLGLLFILEKIGIKFILFATGMVTLLLFSGKVKAVF
ncbi:hypothetical protein VKT23_004610 [Stygiomarasmius scandens]|uniref:Uncharacterized protein n=1 Tax=Marasmiellus scandens TaxID=2682957 RepID=A0ABR1JX59_9AGAR